MLFCGNNAAKSSVGLNRVFGVDFRFLYTAKYLGCQVFSFTFNDYFACKWLIYNTLPKTTVCGNDLK